MNRFSGPERVRVSLALFAFALVLGGVLPSPSALGQTLESRVENLEAHDEILRSRQEVLTSDVSDFKADVAEATTAIRAEMDMEVTGVRADMATGDSAIRTEMAAENTAIRTEMAAIHSLPAADGDPTEAVYVDNAGNVGIGTTAPEKKLHVAGDLIVAGTLTASTTKGFPSPDYDSGWFPASRDQVIPKSLPFVLTDLPSLIQTYVSDVPSPMLGVDKVYLMNQAEYFYFVYNGDNLATMGAFIKLATDSITVITGESRLFGTYNAGNPNDNQVWNSGYLRVKLWK